MKGMEDPEDVRKIAQMFRQHDTAPDGVVSPLYRQLTREWAELHARSTTSIEVARWGRREPLLAGFTRPGDIVDAIDAADKTRTNDLLLALLRLFQSGRQLAGRTLLQSFLPKLCHTSSHASYHCTSNEESWTEDRRHITLAEFWAVIAEYPVDRRSSSVASNLVLDTLHRVSGVRTRPQPAPVDTDGLYEAADRAASCPNQPVVRISPEADLAGVVRWGLSMSILSRAEAELLMVVYSPTRSAGFGFGEAAERLGISQAAVRQRCSRAARKLTDAVRAEIAAVDVPWGLYPTPARNPILRVA